MFENNNYAYSTYQRTNPIFQSHIIQPNKPENIFQPINTKVIYKTQPPSVLKQQAYYQNTLINVPKNDTIIPVELNQNKQTEENNKTDNNLNKSENNSHENAIPETNNSHQINNNETDKKEITNIESNQNEKSQLDQSKSNDVNEINEVNDNNINKSNISNINQNNNTPQNKSQDNTQINKTSQNQNDKSNNSGNNTVKNLQNKNDKSILSENKPGKIPQKKTIFQSKQEPPVKKFMIDPNSSLMGKMIPKALPVYNLIKQGNGICKTEEQGIIFCAMTIYQEELKPLSNYTAKYLQTKLGGDWLVIVFPAGKPVDYNMTYISRNDYMYFTLDTTVFQVCRIR